MHIPDGMMSGAICPVTTTLAIAGLAVATCATIGSNHKPSPLHLGAVAAVFCGSDD